MSGEPLTIGILGGMGPEATADLFKKIIDETPAQKDQEHLPVVIVSDPSIPDRTQAILGQGPDPLPFMRRSAQSCIAAGADFLIMPCNTAHYFYPGLQDLSVPVLHMMHEVGRFMVTHHPEVRTLGLLATTGTVRSELYQQALDTFDLEVLTPDEPDQGQVMEAIYGDHGVKAGHYDEPRKIFIAVAQHLTQKGAQAIIAGCTEIPLALTDDDVPEVVLVDPTRILARAAVARAKGSGSCDE